MSYKTKTKKKQYKNVEAVCAHIKSTFNNTLLTVTSLNGDVITRGSAGQFGFKGSRKSTPFAATQIGNKVAKDLLDLGVRQVHVEIQGPGSGRDSVVRALQSSGLNIVVLRDVTPLPHNGCRPPKKRRV